MEYMVIQFGPDDWTVSIQSKLNEFSKYGFRVVACVCRGEDIIYTLERDLSDD